MPKKESFRNAVLDKKGRVFADFSATWCGPCKMFEPTIDRLVEGGIPVHKVDVDADPNLVAEYLVMSVPTMILFENGQPIGSYTGVKTYDDLKKIYEA